MFKIPIPASSDEIGNDSSTVETTPTSFTCRKSTRRRTKEPAFSAYKLIPSFETDESPICPDYNKSDIILKSSKFDSVAKLMTRTEQPADIKESDQLYYLGLEVDTNGELCDDESGFYKVCRRDHLAFRYEILETVGTGNFGQVVRCFDHKENKQVAIKIIRNSKIYRESGDSEVQIISNLAKSDNNDKNLLVKLLDFFTFRDHLCIVYELLSINLFQLLQKLDFRGLSAKLTKRICRQVVRALSFVHSEKIIHCDLKLDNILLISSQKSDIKLIDFGSACTENCKINDYIQARSYRAPEIILDMEYSKAIDMWSLGCIIVELVTGSPLFQPESEKELLRMHVETIGMPERKFINKGRRAHMFFDRFGKLKVKAKANSRTIQIILQGQDFDLVNFVTGCLKWAPQERMTAEEALRHPWLKKSKFNKE